MTDFSVFDRRPIIVAIAGPNGAGKSTFYRDQLRRLPLPFVNADEIAKETAIGAYEAADRAEARRQALVRERESFIFETVLSDPVGEKVDFLSRTERSGYTTVLCFIGISSPDVSELRVAMRVTQGGHDVPSDKLRERYSRTSANLRRAISSLSNVLVYDNSDLSHPYREVARFQRGSPPFLAKELPAWLSSCLPDDLSKP